MSIKIENMDAQVVCNMVDELIFAAMDGELEHYQNLSSEIEDLKDKNSQLQKDMEYHMRILADYRQQRNDNILPILESKQKEFKKYNAAMEIINSTKFLKDEFNKALLIAEEEQERMNQHIDDVDLLPF